MRLLPESLMAMRQKSERCVGVDVPSEDGNDPGNY